MQEPSVFDSGKVESLHSRLGVEQQVGGFQFRTCRPNLSSSAERTKGVQDSFAFP